MKQFIFIISLIALSAAATTADQNKLTKKAAAQTGAKLSTEMSFDELNVHGHYQAGDEGYATVENEKGLKDLLDYRQHYKDRLRYSRLQR
jgi:opacity protein-like surface antigen